MFWFLNKVMHYFEKEIKHILNTKHGKERGKILPKYEDISGAKAHAHTHKQLEIFRQSQMSFSIRRE